MSDSASSNHSDHESHDSHDIDYADPEQPQVQVILPVIPVSNGEENEDCIFKMRAKLYRFRDEEWKERGIGILKLLRHKESNKIRFIMRQEKTLKVIANFKCKCFHKLNYYSG